MARHPATIEDVAACLDVDLQCSAEGRVLAWDLAESAASIDRPEETPSPEAIDRGRVWLPGIDPDRAARRVGVLSRLITARQRLQDREIPPDVIRREIERGKLDWIRVDCRIADFESEARAREALLCIVEDRLPLERVAADARVPVQEGRYYLADLDPEIRSRLLGSAPGEVVGPIPLGPGYRLVLLMRKELPSEADPEVVRLATDRTRARALADRVARRIRWVDPSLAPR
jgi:hypothetical protein